LFSPLHKLHLLQLIPDINFLSRLGPSSWSSCEWFPFVYSFYYAGFGHSIYVSKPTQSLGFNVIYYVPVFNHLKAELNPICHLLALLGSYHILHVSRVRVKTGNSSHYWLNIILNSVRHHNYFITQGNYIGYMFRL
jgi:hypothetical protein